MYILLFPCSNINNNMCLYKSNLQHINEPLKPMLNTNV